MKRRDEILVVDADLGSEEGRIHLHYLEGYAE